MVVGSQAVTGKYFVKLETMNVRATFSSTYHTKQMDNLINQLCGDLQFGFLLIHVYKMKLFKDHPDLSLRNKHKEQSK